MIGESSENYAFTLVLVDMNTQSYLEDSYPLGVPIDLAEFIHDYCVCVHCGASLSIDLTPCSCGLSKENGLHLEASYPTDIYNTIFRQIIERENTRINNLRRRERLKANGGTYTDAEISKLYDIQEGICFFCGTILINESGKPCYHIDHYVPVLNGGKNDITNLVLACPTCNMKKSAISGDNFEQIVEQGRDKKISRKLKAIRHSLQKHIEQHLDK